MTSAERSLGAQWVLATVVGWIIGFAVCEALKTIVTTVFVDGLVIGTAIGLAQWFVLRRRFSAVGWWVVFTVVGFGVGKAVSDAVPTTAPAVLGYVLSGAIIGASVGLAQWLIQRRQGPSARWWVPASTLGWAVGWGMIGLAENAVGLSTIAVYLVGALGAGTAGLVTAATLVNVARSPDATGHS